MESREQKLKEMISKLEWSIPSNQELIIILEKELEALLNK